MLALTISISGEGRLIGNGTSGILSRGSKLTSFGEYLLRPLVAGMANSKVEVRGMGRTCPQVAKMAKSNFLTKILAGVRFFAAG